VTFGGFVGLASYLAIFFRDQYGLGIVDAGDLTAGCVLAASLARPVGGFVADRLGGTRVLLMVFALIAVAMSLLSHLPPLSAAVTLILGAMLLMGVGNGAVFQLLPQRFGDRMGSVTGLVGACGGIGGFAVPFVAGGMHSLTGSYAGGFLLLALPAGLCAVALARFSAGWLADGGRRPTPRAGAPAPLLDPRHIEEVIL
jgi:NNP family nitrate/nitrite transporter-like MFS transporter